MSFINEKPIKAVRKRHICEACRKYIEIGEPAVNWAGMVDGDFCSSHYHPECREAEVRLNQDVLDWRDCDDWVLLCDAEPENFRWLKTNHPVAYRRMLTPCAKMEPRP